MNENRNALEGVLKQLCTSSISRGIVRHFWRREEVRYIKCIAYVIYLHIKHIIFII